MAYLPNYYCNYHSGPVPGLNFRVWLFLAYFEHAFGLFWPRGPGNPDAQMYFVSAEIKIQGYFIAVIVFRSIGWKTFFSPSLLFHLAVDKCSQM